ncbi:MAG: CTP-dependent riboflavin kinase [Deltaproteobacteria bacterium]|nr:CTP-dependent riboflavin kinase [Deltaproteobacteria bacterium]
MAGGKKITGVIFSDLGQAASFMSLDWVQNLLQEKVGFKPYPATLNLRLESATEIRQWKLIREENPGLDFPPADAGFCSARLFLVEIAGRIPGAVLLPEVKDYPANKIELVAPVHLKEILGLQDGGSLTLEFLAMS